MLTRRYDSRRSLACLLAIATAFGLALSDLRAQEGLGKTSSVHDSARMFSAQAVEKADAQLSRMSHQSGISALVETIESLGGRSIEDVSLKNSARHGANTVYILLAKEEHKIEVRVSQEARSAVGEIPQREIRDAFIQGLRTGDADGGLRLGVDAIVRILAKAHVATATTEKDWGLTQAADGSPLVVRNQVRLTLAGARTVIAGAEKKAAEMKLKVNIAVVDDGGHLITFERMDGARPASGYTATTKATTAATFRQETGPLPKGAASPDPLLNISLQNAASASGGKLTTLFGGIPVVVDGQIIGAVGVGGGSGEQDAIIGKAGVEAFQRELTKGQDAPKAPEGEKKPEEK